VEEGCWYVQVAAAGYLSRTSPVVGMPAGMLPPVVTGLDLALMPMPSYGVALAPNRTGTAYQGQVVTYTHVLTNTGNRPDTFDLEVTSSQGWDVLLGGLYPSGTAHLPWQMDPGMAATLLVSVTVPAGAIDGTVDTTTVTATSRTDPGVYDTVTDRSIVRQMPGVALAPDRVGRAHPGSVVTYTHVLTNTGNGPDTFDLAVASSQGWEVTLGGLHPSGTAHLPWPMDAGMTATIMVSVTVPAETLRGMVDTTTVTATSQLDPVVFAVALDTTAISTYDIFLPLLMR
jgi:uncharacterized membrane protein